MQISDLQIVLHFVQDSDMNDLENLKTGVLEYLTSTDQLMIGHYHSYGLMLDIQKLGLALETMVNQ